MQEYFFVIYSLLILFFLTKIYYRRSLFILSPVDIFVFFFLTVIVSSALYHNFYAHSEKFNLYNFDTLNRKHFIKQVLVFLRMLALFLFGVFLFKSINLNYPKLCKQRIKIINTKKLNFNYGSISRITLIVLLITVLLVYIDYGNEFFIRAKYIPKDNSVFKTIYTISLILLSVLAGVLIKTHYRLATTTIIIVVIIGIGLGSRMATINLLFFFITYSVFLKSQKSKFLYYLVVIPFIVFFFGYNLSLRLESAGHGLIPYLKITVNKPHIIFKYTLMNIYYTFIYGFYATSETIKLYHQNINTLITCISPLPGRFTNWYSIAERMRINKFAPYTSIGEIAKFPIFSFFYYIFLGFYFAYVDRFIRTEIIKKKYFVAIIIVLLLCLFTMFFFEYNFRSSNRFIYYTAVLLSVSIYLNRFKRIKFVWKK